MNVEQLLSLNPKHLDELRSFYCVCPFDDVEVVAQEQEFIEQNLGTFATPEFEEAYTSFGLLHPVGGKDRTHFVFGDTALYKDLFLVSYVSDGEIEDRVIFKVIHN